VIAEIAARESDPDAAAEGSEKPEAPEHTQEQISELRNEYTNKKSELDSKLHEIAQDNLEVKLPPAVKERNKLNLILLGPNGAGKTVVANYMA